MLRKNYRYREGFHVLETGSWLVLRATKCPKMVQKHVSYAPNVQWKKQHLIRCSDRRVMPILHDHHQLCHYHTSFASELVQNWTTVPCGWFYDDLGIVFQLTGSQFRCSQTLVMQNRTCPCATSVLDSMKAFVDLWVIILILEKYILVNYKFFSFSSPGVIDGMLHPMEETTLNPRFRPRSYAHLMWSTSTLSLSQKFYLRIGLKLNNCSTWMILWQSTCCFLPYWIAV